ncbi:hypothetical protein [uncultured Planktomarina sp.]
MTEMPIHLTAVAQFLTLERLSYRRLRFTTCEEKILTLEHSYGRL